jgi:putative membrane protein
MSDLLRLLVGSLLLRPYVFIFLMLHLVGAAALLGWRRTGIPFGWYYYIPRTADRELWILGVPFFDSLSFPFLLVASYALAWLLLTQGPAGEGKLRRPGRGPHLVLTALLFILIDVVIDPLALRGDRWFLGQIYGYPEPGRYFGVPLLNFVGWGVVGLLATCLYQAWEAHQADAGTATFRGRALLCPGLYFIVLGFNLTVTFAIGEWGLGLCGVALSLPLLLWTRRIVRGPRVLGWRPRREGIRA